MRFSSPTTSTAQKKPASGLLHAVGSDVVDRSTGRAKFGAAVAPSHSQSEKEFQSWPSAARLQLITPPDAPRWALGSIFLPTANPPQPTPPIPQTPNGRQPTISESGHLPRPSFQPHRSTVIRVPNPREPPVLAAAEPSAGFPVLSRVTKSSRNIDDAVASTQQGESDDPSYQASSSGKGGGYIPSSVALAAARTPDTAVGGRA